MSELNNYLKVRNANMWLRMGLIYVFAYVPVASTLDPESYFHYVPPLIASFVAPSLAVQTLSVVEIGLVVLLIWGKYLKAAGLLSALLLLAIVGFNFPYLPVTFRNVAIVAMSFALMYLAEK